MLKLTDNRTDDSTEHELFLVEERNKEKWHKDNVISCPFCLNKKCYCPLAFPFPFRLLFDRT